MLIIGILLTIVGTFTFLVGAITVCLQLVTKKPTNYCVMLYGAWSWVTGVILIFFSSIF